MGIWQWATTRLGLTTSADARKWKDIYYPGGDEFVSTNEAAMKLSTWWAASRLITETISTLPNGIFQKLPDGDRKSLPDHSLYKLLRESPNSEQNAVEFWEGRIGPLMWDGNSYAEKSFIGKRLVALLPMPVAQVTVSRRKSDNELEYKFNDRGKVYTLPPDKVFHIKGYAPNDEDTGLSPLAYAGRSLGTSQAADRAGNKIYSSGMRAAGFFSAPADMTEEQRKQFYTNYVARGEGAVNEGKALIFPPGFDWHAMNITPKDAELILTRSFSVEDTCRWMGVPPVLVGHSSAGQTMFGTGVEQIILMWLVLGLRARLRRVEATVNYRLLTPEDRANGIYFEFNFEGLLRADSAARATLMSTLAQNGLRTRNELRTLDNYNKIDGADELTVQSNLTPLDKLGEVPPTQTPGGIDPAVQQQQKNADETITQLRNWLMHERNAA